VLLPLELFQYTSVKHSVVLVVTNEGQVTVGMHVPSVRGETDTLFASYSSPSVLAVSLRFKLSPLGDVLL